MALRTLVVGFAFAVLLGANGCCWHHWGHCCHYYEPREPRVIVQPAPAVIVQPVRTVP